MEVIWAPGGRTATSETATVPSGRWNHSRWVSPDCGPRARRAVGAVARMPSYSGPLTSRGSSTIHWIHGLRSTSSGVGR